MSHRTIKILLVLNLLMLCVIALRPVLTPRPAQAQAPATQTQASKDNEELARLYREDQADRTSSGGKPIDWDAVEGRDKARLARVKELYAQNRLQTGADYFHTAMVLQHGGTPEDYLLAHELCVAAISKGNKEAKWLAAASEDRFLMTIGRPQRFATQYRSEGGDSPLKLYQVDSGVTDELRRAMDVPPLAKAKAKEAELNKK